jgi:hypothetical protein
MTSKETQFLKRKFLQAKIFEKLAYKGQNGEILIAVWLALLRKNNGTLCGHSRKTVWFGRVRTPSADKFVFPPVSLNNLSLNKTFI